MAVRRRAALLFILSFGIPASGYAGPAAEPGGALPSDAVASQPLIRGSVTAGFGGYYRIGRCMPLRVHLENSGADLTGEVSVQVAGDRFFQPISLPSPSRKILSLYVIPPKDLHDLEISVSAGGKTLASFRTNVQRVSDDEQLNVVSSALKSIYPAVEETSESQSIERRVFSDVEDLPENWSDYEAVDAITLDSADTIRLNESQRTAMSQWVLLGGKVGLISGNGAVASNPGIAQADEMAPQVTRRGLGMFSITRGLKRPARSSTEAPARIVRASISDLDHEIFQTCRIVNPVSRGRLAWYFAGFLLLYGTTISFWLRPSRPPGLEKIGKFLPVAVIASLFALLSLALGSVVNGGRLLVRQTSVIHVFPNTVDTFTTNDSVVLSPHRGSYRFTPAAAYAYLIQTEASNRSQTQVYQFDGKNGPSTIAHLDLWDTKVLESGSFSDKAILPALQKPEGVILANRSGFPLIGCAWIGKDFAVPLGDMPQNQELRLDRDFISGISKSSLLYGFHPDFLARVIGAYQTEITGGLLGDCVVCGLKGLIPGLASPDGAIHYEGSAAVIFHLGTYPAEGGT